MPPTQSRVADTVLYRVVDTILYRVEDTILYRVVDTILYCVVDTVLYCVVDTVPAGGAPSSPAPCPGPPQPLQRVRTSRAPSGGIVLLSMSP